MKVFVDVHDKRWNKFNIDFEKIACAVVGKKYKDAEVSIILTDDAEIRDINSRYRNIDKPTNVLSFELGDDLLFGDIYISFDTVERQAHDAKISLHDHAAHMVVHGMFHLLGYDHITDDEASVMELKEINALKKIGIGNPYASENEFECSDGSCCPGAKTIAWFKKFKIRENGFWQYALYALFGGVAAFGFAPFYQWWWTLVGVMGAYWLTVRNKNIGGFWRTFVRVMPFGAMYAVANFWWVLHSIYVVPEVTQQFAIWTIPGILGLALAGALIFVWPFVAVGCVKTSAASRVFLFSGVWAIVLWAREWMFTGFPWNPIANITMPMPMMANSMSLWGALGLSAIIAGLVAAVVEVMRQKKSVACWSVLGIFVLLLMTGCWYGARNMRAADIGADVQSQIIRIVQPGMAQAQKATHDREQLLKNAEENVSKLVDLARGPGMVDFVVFPETAYPFVVIDGDDISMARAINAPIVFGANTFGHGGLRNSMVVVNESGVIQQVYSKSHLVPFGEYRPLGILPAPVNLTPGDGPELVEVNGFMFAPAICYEVIFSDSLLPGDVTDVTAIINVTNDNWFGRTPGTYQHLDMVRRYAIESGMPIVRANYSGISAFVASDGVIISSLPVGASGALDGYVWGAHNTPYRMLGLNGWFIIVLMLFLIIRRLRKRKNSID